MANEKKSSKQDNNCKKGEHVFVVTAWMNKGGQQRAIEMRCRKCLMPMDMEELASKEWRIEEGIDEQPSS